MDTLLIMLKNVLIFVLLAIPGLLLIKGKLLKPQDSGAMSKMLTNVGMPALILSNTLNLELTGEFAVSLLVTAVVSVAFMVLTFLFSGLLCRDKNAKTNGMMRFCAVFINSGFIGIPLASAVFPGNTALMAFLIVTNIVMNVTLFTLGVYAISGDKSNIRLKKAVLNPVFLAFVVGIVLNLLGVGKITEVHTFVNHLKGIVTGLSMTVLGMKLAEVPFKKLFTSGKMYYVSFLRLVLFPVLGVAVMLGLKQIPFFSIDANAVVGFFMGVAMPTAALASALSDQYDGDIESAAVLTLGTTILSVVTIPVLYWLLMLLV